MRSSLVVLAKGVARDAGHLLRARGGESVGVVSALGKDIKTQADVAAEQLILARLAAGSGFAALAEESGGAYDERGESPTWIVDPLDGTLNHSREIPLATVSIGLWQAGKPLLGVVYDFNRDELFCGVVGHGADCNERPLRVSATASRAEGVFCTGFPSARSYDTSSLLEFVLKVQEWKKIRLLGSAALSLAWVAAGRADAYGEDDIQFWDVAAGLPLVLAAGGDYTCTAGTAGWRRKVLASNGLV